MINDMQKQIIDITLRRGAKSIYLFGHSMGGLVAYEIAKCLRTQYSICVKALFVSSCLPFSLMQSCDSIKVSNDEEIKNFLKENRQMSNKVLSSKFFEVSLLPAIKNDFRILNEYLKSKKDDMILDIPIFCFYGKDDTVIEVEKIYKWKEYSNKKCEFIEFVGNHFYLYNADITKKICSIINMILSTMSILGN